ncbi:MAG TPA: hypothetical protein VNF47_15145 [Streptosporangiaceae bacterium]|nr:hypothetical protein [Streptosporangiaceae bacterium]
MSRHAPGLDSELAAIMADVAGPGGRFGHREHLHLAFIAARRYGPQAAPGLLCDWIRQVAASHGAPQKYHATMTIAWACLVAHHSREQPAVDFDSFIARYPALTDKDLLTRHYTAEVLGSAAARSRWIAPDRAPLPGSQPPRPGDSGPGNSGPGDSPS